MRILNLFAGIGGNRELWGNTHEIIAIEKDPQIAMLYQKRFPNDKVYCYDAYNYLIEFHDKFDIIWASPPCQTHTIANHFLYSQGVRRLPDLRLYALIIFLKTWSKANWIVENVRAYYPYLIKPTCIRGRHVYWSNVNIPSKEKMKSEIKRWGTTAKNKMRKRRENSELNQAERNKVNAKEGKLLLDYLIGKKQIKLEEWIK